MGIITLTFTSFPFSEATLPENLPEKSQAPYNLRIIEGDNMVAYVRTLYTSLMGNLIVESGILLTINPGVTLDIDFANQKILIKFGGGILIKSGGTIT